MSFTASEVVFCCGARGSGKTAFLYRYFLPRAPRLLLVDQTGEWQELEPAAPRAYGLSQTCELLAAVAPLPSWTAVAYLSREDLLELSASMFCPMPDPRRSSYCRHIGGMALLLDEIQTWAGPSYFPPPLQNLFRLGRHVGLSIYAATQRAGNCSKEVTAQCRFIAALRQDEPLDVDYLRSRIGREVFNRALEVIQTIDYSAFLWDRDRRRGHLVDRDGEVLAELAPELGP